MVGTVLVSHSQALAEAMVDYAHMMAPQAVVVAAGGLEDGTFGTSYEKIEAAIEQAQQGDGVVVLMDMGSAVMTVKNGARGYGRRYRCHGGLSFC